MTGEREQRVKELLAQLLDTPARERAGVLELVCAGDVELRSEVESLARAYEEGSDFFATRPTTEDFTNSPAVGSRIGRYHLVKQLGEGGFGTVFLAEQQHPVRRRVALKLIKLGMDTKRVIARFDAERQALAMMDHPHIARVYDAGATVTGRPYFVMELVEGVPITKFCDENKLTIRERLQLFIQVCQAVQHAHTKGIIHRDLKPTNILVSQQDGIPVPKVIDFGIAKATLGRLTEHSVSTEQAHWLGTPQYMSPEQADGSADIDTRTDIYSLGVILFELLTGTTPFEAAELRSKSYSEIRRVVREIEPPRPSARLNTLGRAADPIAATRGTDVRRLSQSLRGDLDSIALEVLEKDRTRRYQTPNGLAMDVLRHLSDEPVAARPPTAAYRLVKIVRRHKVGVSASVALFISLVSGIIGTSIGMLRARAWGALAEQRRKESANALADSEAQTFKARRTAYDSDMLGVQGALGVGNLGRARELLYRHRGDKDLLGWEWRYLWQQCRGDPALQLCRRSKQIASLSISPDGRFVAVGEDDDGGLSVWDLRARKEIARPPGADGGFAVFSPREPLLAYTAKTSDPSLRHRRGLRLWDLRQGKVIATADLKDDPQGMTFSPDGKTLATNSGFRQGRLAFWRVPELIDTNRSFPVSNPDGFNTVCFDVTPDLRWAAMVFSNNTAGVIDLKTGKQWSEAIDPAWATAVAFSPDGKVVAFSKGSADAAIHLRDTASGKPLTAPLTGHSAWIGQLVFWPDGKTLASASADQTIRLWDVSDPARAKPIGRPLRGHEAEVWRLALLPDNKTLVSGAKDGSVLLWDSTVARQDPVHWHTMLPRIAWDFEKAGATLITVDRAGQMARSTGVNFSEVHPVMELGPIEGASLGDHGRILTTFSPASGLKIRDLESGRLLQAHPRAPQGEADFYAVTPEQHLLYHFESDNTAVEWDPIGGREVVWHPSGGIYAYAVAPGGSWRVTLGWGGAGTMIDGGSRSIPLDLQLRAVSDAGFSPDGRLLAVVSGNPGSVGLWRTADVLGGGNKPPIRTLTGFMLAPHSLAFSPDGKRLAAGSGGREAVRLYDTESFQDVLTLAATGAISHTIRFSPDGNVLACENEVDELHLWRAPTMAEIEATESDRTNR